MSSREYKPFVGNKINQLWYQGHVVFERWELLSWYSKDRITGAVWRDLEESWTVLFPDGEAPPLGVIKCDDSATPQKYLVVNTAAVVPIHNLT